MIICSCMVLPLVLYSYSNVIVFYSLLLVGEICLICILYFLKHLYIVYYPFEI